MSAVLELDASTLVYTANAAAGSTMAAIPCSLPLCYDRSAPWRMVEARAVVPCSEATAMIIIGIILSLFAIAFFCWLLFTLAVYALPVFVALSAGFAAYHDGYTVGAAMVTALAAGGATLLVGQFALSMTRMPLLRAAIALAFALPAGIAGYYASLGIAHLCIGSGAPSMTLAVTGAVLVFGTAWMRMVAYGPPPTAQGLGEEQLAPAAYRRAGPDGPLQPVLGGPHRRSRGGR